MRYLTKSRFKLATECPTKLFYTRKKEYADQSLEDSFLEEKEKVSEEKVSVLSFNLFSQLK
jgi:hypothetical protein